MDTPRLTRFSVPPLHQVTRELAAVASGRTAPELVLTGAAPDTPPAESRVDLAIDASVAAGALIDEDGRLRPAD